MQYVEYKLYLENETPVIFRVNLAINETKQLVKQAPEWTKLENNQCSHCPLASSVTYCPLAIRIIPFVQELSHLSSVETIKFEVTQFEQVKKMQAPAQDVLGSLLGLYMATSDCPYTNFLRPMAHFHLPLADPDETLYRVLSMYRLGQYFKQQHTNNEDKGFESLQQAYDDMSKVNQMLSNRIREALVEQKTSQDGTINAVVLLDALSQYVPASTEEALEDLAPIFKYYTQN